jgi:endonuclease/exonuclease/phosphatase family metal-dependent hydrolase
MPIPGDCGCRLSSFPLEEVTAVVLPFEKMRRVAIMVTASGVTSSGESWRLRICNAHLDNRTQFTRQFGFGGIVGRLRQTRALVELIDEPAAIIGGDFNTWAPGALERCVELAQADFPQPRRLPKDPTIIARFLPDRRVDYLLFRTPENSPQSYRRIADAYGSDHYPLFSMFPVVSAVDSTSLQ